MERFLVAWLPAPLLPSKALGQRTRVWLSGASPLAEQVPWAPTLAQGVGVSRRSSAFLASASTPRGPQPCGTSALVLEEARPPRGALCLPSGGPRPAPHPTPTPPSRREAANHRLGRSQRDQSQAGREAGVGPGLGVPCAFPQVLSTDTELGLVPATRSRQRETPSLPPAFCLLPASSIHREA